MQCHRNIKYRLRVHKLGFGSFSHHLNSLFLVDQCLIFEVCTKLHQRKLITITLSSCTDIGDSDWVAVWINMTPIGWLHRHC